MVEQDKSSPFQRLDLSGLFCPAVVLEVRTFVDQCSPATLVEVISTDPLSMIDIPLFARKSGHRIEHAGQDAGKCVFRLLVGDGAAGKTTNLP